MVEVLDACGVLLGGNQCTWQVPHEDASMALEGSSEEANEAAGTRATSGVRLLVNGIHTDGVNAGLRMASSGTWRTMQKQGSSGTAPAAWRVACDGGQLLWGRTTGVRSGRDLA